VTFGDLTGVVERELRLVRAAQLVGAGHLPGQAPIAVALEPITQPPGPALDGPSAATVA
jgi:hypothetical protein